MSEENSLESVLSRIQHQLFGPLVTTMGHCPSCKCASRGSGLCARCLSDKYLSKLVGPKLAEEYTKAAELHSAARFACLSKEMDI